MKKRKIILSTVLAIVLLFGALGIAEAAEIAPLYAAVNDAKILLSISKDGTAEAYISVMPKNKDAIDYVSVNACIVKKSTASTVKTWKNFRVEQNPNTRKFNFYETYQLTVKGAYYLDVKSVKCYKNGKVVDTIGPLQSTSSVF